MTTTPVTAMPMTRARRTILFLGVPAVLAVLGWAAFNAVALADQVSYRAHISAPVTGRRVSVSVGSADATFLPGSGPRILVNAALRGSLARPSFGWRSTAAGLALTSACPPMPAGLCSLSYVITVPAGLPAALSASSGDLTAGDLSGHVTLSDDSGDLNANGLSGTVSIAEGSGDVGASGLSGAVSLSDYSGDITVSGLRGGAVRLASNSGEILVTGLAGTDVVGRDVSGDITLTFTRVPRKVDVTSGSGNITLVLPPGATRYHVVTRDGSGNATVSVPQSRSSPYTITATDGAGNINIS
jgi:Putative adhesin